MNWFGGKCCWRTTLSYMVYTVTCNLSNLQDRPNAFTNNAPSFPGESPVWWRKPLWSFPDSTTVGFELSFHIVLLRSRPPSSVCTRDGRLFPLWRLAFSWCSLAIVRYFCLVSAWEVFELFVLANVESSLFLVFRQPFSTVVNETEYSFCTCAEHFR